MTDKKVKLLTKEEIELIWKSFDRPPYTPPKKISFKEMRKIMREAYEANPWQHPEEFWKD